MRACFTIAKGNSRDIARSERSLMLPGASGGIMLRPLSRTRAASTFQEKREQSIWSRTESYQDSLLPSTFQEKSVNPLLVNGHVRPVCPLAPKRRGVADRESLNILRQIYIGSLHSNSHRVESFLAQTVRIATVKRRRDDRMSSLICRALPPRTLLQHARIPDHIVGPCQDDPRRLVDIIYII